MELRRRGDSAASRSRPWRSASRWRMRPRLGAAPLASKRSPWRRFAVRRRWLYRRLTSWWRGASGEPRQTVLKHRMRSFELALLIVAVSFPSPTPREPPTTQQILDAIRVVESGGRDDCPDGDGGLSIGPFQIGFAYWSDATRADPSLAGEYQDCRRRDYAERVVEAYMRHYVPDAWLRRHAEVIARTHNGGPNGVSRAKTDRYWEKVRTQLNKLRS